MPVFPSKDSIFQLHFTRLPLDMKTLTPFIVFIIFFGLSTQMNAQDRPTYCDELPTSYEKGATRASSRPSLPKFDTKPVSLYKVQVAILRNTDPSNYPFHSKLVARFRPCEEVWVIESRETFTTRAEANRLKAEMLNVGYPGSYVTTVMGYQ